MWSLRCRPVRRGGSHPERHRPGPGLHRQLGGLQPGHRSGRRQGRHRLRTALTTAGQARTSGWARADRSVRAADRTRGGSRPARDRPCNDRGPSSGNPIRPLSQTATVPLRPPGSRLATQRSSTARFALAIRPAAWHGSPPRPIWPAAASAARSASRCSRCRPRIAADWISTVRVTASTRATRPSSQIDAEPRSANWARPP